MTTLEEKVDQLTEDVTEIKTILKGYNGGMGLIPTFEKHCKSDEKFRNRALIIFGILIGSGILTVGIVNFL